MMGWHRAGGGGAVRRAPNPAWGALADQETPGPNQEKLLGGVGGGTAYRRSVQAGEQRGSPVPSLEHVRYAPPGTTLSPEGPSPSRPGLDTEMRDGEFGKHLKEAVNHRPEATRTQTTGLNPGASQGPRSGPCLSLCPEKPEACLGLLRVRGGAQTGSFLFLNNFEEIQFTYIHVIHPFKMFSYLSISYLRNSSPLSNFRSFSSLHKAKRNPVSIRSHYLLPATSSLPSVLTAFLFWTFHVNGITRYVAFCDWLFPFSIESRLCTRAQATGVSQESSKTNWTVLQTSGINQVTAVQAGEADADGPRVHTTETCLAQVYTGPQSSSVTSAIWALTPIVVQLLTHV